MAWITLTEADALTGLNAKLLDALRTRVKAAGQADPLPLVIVQVVDQVRGAVGASGRYTLGEGATIPAKLKAAALDLLAIRLMNRLDMDLSEGKMTLYKSAEATLRDVRDGRFDIEEPLVRSEEASSAPKPRITARTRTFSRADGDGS
jgi:hypothetical protein